MHSDTLLEAGTKIEGEARLFDPSGQLDCEKLEEDWNATDSRPGSLRCDADESSAFRGNTVMWSLLFGQGALLALLFML